MLESRRRRLPLIAGALAAAALAPPAGADTYPRQPGVDAIHYVFRLALDDASDEIRGEAEVRLRFVSDGVSEVFLDLTSVSDGKGMTVESATLGERALDFAHEADRLRLPLGEAPAAGGERTLTIRYGGVPADGLRFLANVHGERSVFSESWPNRARQWLPMIDHPYDKATGEMIVTAPAHYQVVSNGLLVEELDLPGGLRRTHWRQSVPIASWLYALGVARFSVHHAGSVEGIPVQTWVFPQDREKGQALFEDLTRRTLRFYDDAIGPFSYEKLANVQAAGIRGGMESATSIFYGDQGVTASRAPVVHEIAHQWWGNAVTEDDWDDVWLSEGFATYFTLLFTEHDAGRDAFVAGLKESRERVLRLEQEHPDTPIVHRNLDDMSRVLTGLVYQKGAWVLHMLRARIGTEAFWTGIRDYYRRYRDANASTDDFRLVMEEVSGQRLDWFFDQWLNRSGLPRIDGSWRYDDGAREVVVMLSQTQAGAPYRLPVEIGITPRDPSAEPRVASVELVGSQASFRFPAEAAPADVVLDPDTWLLTEPGEFARRR